MSNSDKKYVMALDAGGTMTDAFVVDEQGRFTLGKALTNRANEATSYISSLEAAAGHWGVTSANLHEKAVPTVYTGTTMLNILLTRTGSKIGLLMTKGFAHMPILERALTWLGQSYEDILHQQLREHTPWLVQPEHVKEVTERISVGSYYMGHHYAPGRVVIPLIEEDVVKGVNELLHEGIEVIGILTLASYINPMHEKRIAEIARQVVQQHGADVAIFASHEICPLAKENLRLKTLLLQCYVTKVARDQLLSVEQAAKRNGCKYELLTLLSYGAVANIRYPKLVEAVVSGPVGGLLGAKAVGEKTGHENVISIDIGGTSLDAGLIITGLIPLNKEPVFAGHRLRIPMVSIDSIAAGGGIVIHVDKANKRITLGPDSAGSHIGTCYDYPDITITDVNLILGYLNPDYFLGGSVRLDKERALKALQERLATPLGQNVYDISSRVLDLLHSQMCDHIRAIFLSRGLDPTEFTLVAAGGGGPLHTWGIERGIQMGDIFMVPWAAAFSAFGVASAEYFHRYNKAVTFFYTTDMTADVKLYQGMVLSQTWQELEQRAYAEFAAEGIGRKDVHFRYGISGSYVGQISTWEAGVEKGRLETAEDVDKIINAFEKTYTTIYPIAARHPEAGYQISEVYLEAATERVKPIISSYPLAGERPSRESSRGEREAYIDGKWLKFDLWEMDLLEAGNRVDGPAIIEHPMTTVVIPPHNYVKLDEHRFMWYRRHRTAHQSRGQRK